MTTSSFWTPSACKTSLYWTFRRLFDESKILHLNQQPRMPLSWLRSSIFLLNLGNTLHGGSGAGRAITGIFIGRLILTLLHVGSHLTARLSEVKSVLLVQLLWRISLSLHLFTLLEVCSGYFSGLGRLTFSSVARELQLRRETRHWD